MSDETKILDEGLSSIVKYIKSLAENKIIDVSGYFSPSYKIKDGVLSYDVFNINTDTQTRIPQIVLERYGEYISHIKFKSAPISITWDKPAKNHYILFIKLKTKEEIKPFVRKLKIKKIYYNGNNSR